MQHNRPKKYWFHKQGTTTDYTETREYVEQFWPEDKWPQLNDAMDALVPGDKK